MSAWELRLMVGDMLDAAGRGIVWLVKFALVVAVLLSPYALEWVLDGCPSPAEAEERFIEEVKGGWR